MKFKNHSQVYTHTIIPALQRQILGNPGHGASLSHSVSCVAEHTVPGNVVVAVVPPAVDIAPSLLVFDKSANLSLQLSDAQHVNFTSESVDNKRQHKIQ
jgi:hypothetical protein